MDTDLLIQRPATGNVADLVLLFHGVGSRAEDLRPLGEVLASHLPGAWIVSVQSPEPCDLGGGWQWFSVQGVTESNRPARVAAALPSFAERVAAWQRYTRVAPEHTALIGFSQGAIMALESTQSESVPLGANRVLAIAGRFAQPPRRAPHRVTLHLMHGEQDPVIPLARAIEAHRQWQALGGASTLDRFPGLGHGIDGRVVDAITRILAQESVPMSDKPSATLHFGDEEIVIRVEGRGRSDTESHLDLGALRIARDFFHHDPPTANEIENAIDFVEDQIARLGPKIEADAELRSVSESLQPWAVLSGPRISVEVVEQWFDRLAAAAQGQVNALDGLPSGKEAAATLLLLREFMHHRGHRVLVFTGPVGVNAQSSEARDGPAGKE